MIIANYAQIAEITLSRRLLSAGNPQAPRVGATIGYGIDNDALHQSAASYIDKIFKGAKPAELPIEQATRFQFVLNLRSARTLGLDLPTATLLRADEVIE